MTSRRLPVTDTREKCVSHVRRALQQRGKTAQSRPQEDRGGDNFGAGKALGRGPNNLSVLLRF